MHAEYARLAEAYPLEKARHAWAILAWLWAPSAVEAMPRGTGAPRPPELGATALEEALAAFSRLTERVEEDVYRSRKKDYENAFRRATFRTAAEAEAVMGSAERNGFVLKTRKDAAALRAAAAELSAGLRG
jgi:hypothetical protein